MYFPKYVTSLPLNAPPGACLCVSKGRDRAALVPPKGVPNPGGAYIHERARIHCALLYPASAEQQSPSPADHELPVQYPRYARWQKQPWIPAEEGFHQSPTARVPENTSGPKIERSPLKWAPTFQQTENKSKTSACPLAFWRTE